MRFKIKSTCYDTVDKIIAKYPCLNEYYFEVEKKTYIRFEKIKDDEGNILKQEYEKPVYTPYIYIYGLDELRRLQESIDVPLIIDWDEGQGIIEIYDGWRE